MTDPDRLLAKLDNMIDGLDAFINLSSSSQRHHVALAAYMCNFDPARALRHIAAMRCTIASYEQDLNYLQFLLDAKQGGFDDSMYPSDTMINAANTTRRTSQWEVASILRIAGRPDLIPKAGR
jgi:hypothetical protein